MPVSAACRPISIARSTTLVVCGSDANVESAMPILIFATTTCPSDLFHPRGSQFLGQPTYQVRGRLLGDRLPVRARPQVQVVQVARGCRRGADRPGHVVDL